jgi:hypothetical protein
LTAEALAKFGTAQASTSCYHPSATTCMIDTSRHAELILSSTQFVPFMPCPCTCPCPVLEKCLSPREATALGQAGSIGSAGRSTCQHHNLEPSPKLGGSQHRSTSTHFAGEPTCRHSLAPPRSYASAAPSGALAEKTSKHVGAKAIRIRVGVDGAVPRCAWQSKDTNTGSIRSSGQPQELYSEHYSEYYVNYPEVARTGCLLRPLRFECQIL